MNTLKGTRTEANLHAAYANETEKQNMYEAFAEIARREGYMQLSYVFEATAQNEREHAKMWLAEIAKPGMTQENLQRALDGENYEHSQFYANFAQVAREEGFPKVADQFDRVAEIESLHAERFAAFLEDLQQAKTFERKETRTWVCRGCGLHVVDASAPAVCPFCQKPKGYFEIYRPLFDDQASAQNVLAANPPQPDQPGIMQ